MYKFNYSPVTDSENPTEIAFHNMKVGEDTFSLEIFIGGQSGYLHANPDKNFQDLEKELRNRNFTTHIIAKPPPDKRTLEYHIGISHRINDDTEYKYEAITSCRPADVAMKELLENWLSYDENFEALKFAGSVIVGTKGKEQLVLQENEQNSSTSCDSTTDKIKLLKNSDPIHLMSVNKVKVSATYIPAEEILQDVIDEVILKIGKQPQLRMVAMNSNGSPIMALTVDNKIVSYTGFVFEYDTDGKKQVGIVNLANLN
jgi:hypothetical protein